MTKKEKLEQRLQELRKDYERKLSSKEFEIKYNASYSTITRILYKHGIMVKNNSAPIKYQFLHDHIDEFKIDWINGILQKHDLEEKYCCSYNTLKSYATELNIKRKSKKEIVDNKAIIEDVLNDILTYDQIMEKYNVSEHIIRTILKDNNISHKRDNRKYYFNINYFDFIDDEHKAYWLGFIYADGSHNLKRYSLYITLQQGDIDILNKFYQDIECNKNIKLYKNKTNGRYYAQVLVQHKHLSKTLIKQGVLNNKSFKIVFPDNNIVPYDLKRHFIRGYFDGDGCVSISKNKSSMSWSMVGNRNFINDMKKYIEDSIENYNMNIHKCTHSEVCSIGKNGRHVCATFLEWLYKDATIYLQRKYDKYLEIKKYNEEKDYERSKKLKKVS